MSSVLQKQLEAVEAQIEVLQAMVAAIRKTAAQSEQPTARVERPATCIGHKTEDCARLSDEAAIEMGGMGGGPVTMMCRGCGEQTVK